MTIQTVYNSDGEILGTEHYYGDEGRWYDDDSYHGQGEAFDGPHEGCCKRGDWNGAHHQPASAWLYMPIVTNRKWLARNEHAVYFSPETTSDYRWECDYCGRVGTRAELMSD